MDGWWSSSSEPRVKEQNYKSAYICDNRYFKKALVFLTLCLEAIPSFILAPIIAFHFFPISGDLSFLFPLPPQWDIGRHQYFLSESNFIIICSFVSVLLMPSHSRVFPGSHFLLLSLVKYALRWEDFAYHSRRVGFSYVHHEPTQLKAPSSDHWQNDFCN